MKLFRWMAVSFSIYSRIPMPRFEWKAEDHGHSLVFFPMVGAVIGVLTAIAYRLSVWLDLPETVTGIVLTLIPVLVTGGFHLDGYMDTMDARRSYGSAEDKLRILKDPHIGAFAVICLVTAALTYIASAVTIVHLGDERAVLAMGVLYVLSRSVSGLLALLIPGAKKDGMLHAETDGNRRCILVSLWIWLTLSVASLVLIGYVYAAAIAAVAVMLVLYYRHMAVSEFGGVTGDTAGYLLTMCEVLGCASIAAAGLLSAAASETGLLSAAAAAGLLI